MLLYILIRLKFVVKSLKFERKGKKGMQEKHTSSPKDFIKESKEQDNALC